MFVGTKWIAGIDSGIERDSRPQTEVPPAPFGVIEGCDGGPLIEGIDDGLGGALSSIGYERTNSWT